MNNSTYKFFFPTHGHWPAETEIKLINESGEKWSEVDLTLYPTQKECSLNGNYICRKKIINWVERKDRYNNTYWNSKGFNILKTIRNDKICFIGHHSEIFDTLEKAKDSFE